MLTGEDSLDSGCTTEDRDRERSWGTPEAEYKSGAWLINSQNLESWLPNPQNPELSPKIPEHWELIPQTRQRVWESDPQTF
jgi:hypothetical protein